MARFRSKPVEIDAVQWTGDLDGIVAWADDLCERNVTARTVHAHVGVDVLDDALGPVLRLWVEKSQAECDVEPGGWVIAEADGDGFYPCTAEVFAARYVALV